MHCACLIHPVWEYIPAKVETGPDSGGSTHWKPPGVSHIIQVAVGWAEPGFSKASKVAAHWLPRTMFVPESALSFLYPQMVMVTPHFLSGISGLVHRGGVSHVLRIQTPAAGAFMSPPRTVIFSHNHEIQFMMMMSAKKHSGKV